jgi:ABC-2 type transport system ATP-binding protein
MSELPAVDHGGVRVRGLRKTFKSGFKQQEVLKGIDLDIEPGEVVGLIGPNGAGKTTLMSCLLGFLFPDEGEVSIAGLANDDLAVRRRSGFVPERMNFDRRATGREFLRYMARLDELPGAEANRRVAELMDRLDIAHGAQKKLSQYSRGMLQRIGMCQALIKMPDFLFLDEPTSGLDPAGVILVREVILEEKQRGATVLVNSHQLAEIEKLCDRVLFLSGGVITRNERLRAESSIEILIKLLPGTLDAAAAADAGVTVEGDVVSATVAREEDVAALIRRLVEAGAGVVGVRPRTADLEQMFRRRT